MKTISRVFLWLTASLLFTLAASPTNAGSVLIAGGVSGYNYTQSPNAPWGRFSEALDVATGDQVAVASNFLNLDQMLQYDAIVVAGRQFGIGGQEVDNIRAYIATGRRVLLVGATNVSSWNDAVLSIVGGSSTRTFSGNATAVDQNSITDGASTIFAPQSGIAIGGTPLYEQAVASFWGENVLSVLSMHIWSNANWDREDNARFTTNVVNWLAGNTTAVPEPSSLIAAGSAAVILGPLGMRRRRGS